MLKQIRAYLCRLFDLVPREEVPRSVPFSLPETGWDSLWEVKDLRICWPRVLMSEVWKTDIEPYFKQTLLRTFIEVTREMGHDENSREKLRRLQERARLINDWLEQPRVAMALGEAAYENAYRSGNLQRFEEERERANGRRRAG